MVSDEGGEAMVEDERWGERDREIGRGRAMVAIMVQNRLVMGDWLMCSRPEQSSIRDLLSVGVD